MKKPLNITAFDITVVIGALITLHYIITTISQGL